MAKHPPADLRWSEKVPALILLVALLFLGFWPKSMSTALNAAMVDLMPLKTPQTSPIQTMLTVDHH